MPLLPPVMTATLPSSVTIAASCIPVNGQDDTSDSSAPIRNAWNPGETLQRNRKLASAALFLLSAFAVDLDHHARQGWFGRTLTKCRRRPYRRGKTQRHFTMVIIVVTPQGGLR